MGHKAKISELKSRYPQRHKDLSGYFERLDPAHREAYELSKPDHSLHGMYLIGDNQQILIEHVEEGHSLFPEFRITRDDGMSMTTLSAQGVKDWLKDHQARRSKKEKTLELHHALLRAHRVFVTEKCEINLDGCDGRTTHIVVREEKELHEATVDDVRACCDHCYTRLSEILTEKVDAELTAQLEAEAAEQAAYEAQAEMEIGE